MPHILFPNADLEAMAGEPVLEAEHMDPGYSDHATDVWRVRTRSGTQALRIFRAAQAWGGPFWDGLKWLFGWQMQDPSGVAARHRFLRAASGLAAPEVLGSGRAGELSYLRMQWMPGVPCDSFAELTPAGLREFGRSLARLHARTFDCAGMLPLPREVPREAFPARVQSTLERLVENYHRERADLRGALGEMLERAAGLLPDAILRESFAPVMMDIDARQYLRQPGGPICAVVDTDACVAGPRALDFINLEYVLMPAQAIEIAGGYTETLPLPELAELRPLYRYLCLALEVQGDPPLEEWLAQPALFNLLVRLENYQPDRSFAG